MIKNIWKPIGQLYFNVFLNPLKFNGTLVSPKEKQEAQRTLKKAKEIEKTTRCIMTAWKEVSSFSNSTYTNHFIFYVTKIKEKWYLTMIDFSWIA